MATAALFASTVPAAAQSDSLVTNTPTGPFAQNKQNEPGIAIDANHRNVVVAGSNDEIDLELCNAGNPTSCPFTDGVGVSGVYFSFDGGLTWSQPTYSGFTARDCVGPAACTPHPGPIGTVPNYFENGLVSDGDPSLAFGPKKGTSGFSWDNGSRLYYANLTSNFSATRSEEAFKGFEAIAVSRTDDVVGAAAGSNASWMSPVLVSKQNAALFSDHEQIWADNASSSPFFGNVYICFAAFRSQENSPNALPEPIIVARSTDGGDTWTQRQVSAATNNSRGSGRQDCGVRTDSKGTLFVFWQGGDVVRGTVVNAIFVARSFDGGQTFERPRSIAAFENCGIFDPNNGTLSFDGLAGARTGSFPSLDIANGAPTGVGASDEVVATWCDGPTPSDTAPGANERAVVKWSVTGGNTYSGPVVASVASDRPDFPAIAITPTGTDIFVVYDAFHLPWQSTTAAARPMEGAVRHAVVGAGGMPGAFTDAHRGASGDARGSSTNSLAAEFLGDYNNIVASRASAVAVWNDVRRAADCPAVDTYRQNLTSASPTAKPAPNTDCAPDFGNSDIFSFNLP